MKNYWNGHQIIHYFIYRKCLRKKTILLKTIYLTLLYPLPPKKKLFYFLYQCRRSAYITMSWHFFFLLIFVSSYMLTEDPCDMVITRTRIFFSLFPSLVVRFIIKRCQLLHRNFSYRICNTLPLCHNIKEFVKRNDKLIINVRIDQVIRCYVY